MNSNELGVAAPSLPVPLLLAVGALSAVLILWMMVRTRHRAGAFVVGSAWLRYMMQAFHTVTYKPLAAGMSANAGDTSGKYVTGVQVANGVITITYGNEANQQINGDTLTLTPYESADLSVAWRCGTANAPVGTNLLGTAAGAATAYVAPTVIDRYLPAACRQ